jgi:hypothetical protein
LRALRFLAGTDALGRDLLTRTLTAGRRRLDGEPPPVLGAPEEAGLAEGVGAGEEGEHPVPKPEAVGPALDRLALRMRVRAEDVAVTGEAVRLRSEASVRRTASPVTATSSARTRMRRASRSRAGPTLLAVVALACLLGPFVTGHPYDRLYYDYPGVPPSHRRGGGAGRGRGARPRRRRGRTGTGSPEIPQAGIDERACPGSGATSSTGRSTGTTRWCSARWC